MQVGQFQVWNQNLKHLEVLYFQAPSLIPFGFNKI